MMGWVAPTTTPADDIFEDEGSVVVGSVWCTLQIIESPEVTYLKVKTQQQSAQYAALYRSLSAEEGKKTELEEEDSGFSII